MRAGDVKALAELYERTAPQVFAIAYRALRSREDAEEIVADVYIHAWRNARSFDPSRGSVKAWLSIMSKNRAIDRFRRRRMEFSMDDSSQSGGIGAADSHVLGPEQMLAGIQSKAAVHRALRSLSEERARLVQLAFFEGQTHDQIAAALGMPLGTVKSHVRRALAEMQRSLLAER